MRILWTLLPALFAVHAESNAQVHLATAGNFASLYRINQAGTAGLVIRSHSASNVVNCTVTWYNPNASPAGSQIPSSRAVTVGPGDSTTIATGLIATFREQLSCTRQNDGAQQAEQQRRLQDEQRRLQEEQRAAAERRQSQDELLRTPTPGQQPSNNQQQALSAERQRIELQNQQNAMLAQQTAMAQQRAESERRRVSEARRQDQRQNFDTAAQGLMALAKEMDDREAAEKQAKNDQEDAKVQQFEAQRLAANTVRSGAQESMLYVKSTSSFSSVSDVVRKVSARPGVHNIGAASKSPSYQATTTFSSQLNDGIVVVHYRTMALVAADVEKGLIDMACAAPEEAKESFSTSSFRAIGPCR